MVALAADKVMSERESRTFQGDVAASTTIYKGSLLARNATGFLVPMTVTTGETAVGVSEENVDNSAGADGAKTCKYKEGTFEFVNDGTNAVDATDIGGTAYAFDDQTVSTNATGTSAAGKIKDYDATADTVWVKVGAGE